MCMLLDTRARLPDDRARALFHHGVCFSSGNATQDSRLQLRFSTSTSKTNKHRGGNTGDVTVALCQPSHTSSIYFLNQHFSLYINVSLFFTAPCVSALCTARSAKVVSHVSVLRLFSIFVPNKPHIAQPFSLLSFFFGFFSPPLNISNPHDFVRRSLFLSPSLCFSLVQGR